MMPPCTITLKHLWVKIFLARMDMVNPSLRTSLHVIRPSINNVGNIDIMVLFWTSEIFNPEKPDTYFDLV